jgi:hypothetical protein
MFYLEENLVINWAHAARRGKERSKAALARFHAVIWLVQRFVHVCIHLRPRGSIQVYHSQLTQILRAFRLGGPGRVAPRP